MASSAELQTRSDPDCVSRSPLMLSLRRVQCGCGLELEIKVAEDYVKFYKAPTKAFSWLKAQHLGVNVH